MSPAIRVRRDNTVVPASGKPSGHGTSRSVSLGAHADVTVAKHVLIICKRKQVGRGCLCALASVAVVARARAGESVDVTLYRSELYLS